MKLYTEEQVYRAMMLRDNQRIGYTTIMIEHLTPIELPTDEEIEEMGKDVIVYNDTKRGWFVEGLRFMRDTIGGNK